MDLDFTLSKGEKLFQDQYTRKLMVDWCTYFFTHKEIKVDKQDEVYFEYAKTKKWVSSKGDKILSLGWSTAARFLKR